VERRVREAAGRFGLDLGSRSHNRTLAFLLGNRPITHPFHSQVMSGAEAYCAERDCHMLFFTLRYPLRMRLSQLPVPRLLERRGAVSGLIVAGVNSPSFIELLAKTQLPLAVFGTTVNDEGVDGLPIVRVDEEGGAADMTHYLQSLGHTAIWFVGNSSVPWLKRRYDAYRQAMEAMQLRPLLAEFDSEDERHVGYLATKSILDRGGTATAIFAGNDHIAQGVYDALRDREIAVGEQVSVAGFNDTLEAVVLHPALTTVRVHAEQVGRQLAELVLRQVESGTPILQTTTIPTRVIKRESCAAAPLTTGAVS
jgi:DNA-binding LacI/PurR family transcriptional regulator